MAEQAKDWRDHVLIMGPAGSGKTLWARLQAGKVPFSERSLRETACEHIYRLARLDERWAGLRPIQSPNAGVFRAPHYTVSEAQMLGSLVNGWQIRPGELSLAHSGVLFLDEANEFRTSLLERVVEVARAGHVRLVRGGGAVTVPAEFRLIAAACECPCGYRGAELRAQVCRCTDAQVERHVARLAPLRKLCRLVPAEEWRAEVKASEVAS